MHRRIRRAPDQTDAKILMHSDGSIRDILADLIDIGVDPINPFKCLPKGWTLRS